MTEADKLQIAHDVLKGFSTAVTTTKLYPQTSPQVKAAEENAFQQIAEYVRHYGEISFFLEKDEPQICGFPVSQKTLGKIPGQEIYQQLRLLGMEYLVLDERLTQSLFKQLLVFFISSPQLINREGGGRSFAVNLGLSDFFPVEYRAEVPEIHEDDFSRLLKQLLEEQRVRSEHVQSVIHPIDLKIEAGQKKLASLRSVKDDEARFADFITAGFSASLKGTQQRIGEISFPASFAVVISNLDKIVERDEDERLARAGAGRLIETLSDFGLHTLLLQDFSSRFCRQLFFFISAGLGKRLDSVASLMGEEKRFLRLNFGTKSDRYKTVSRALERFFETDRGQQFRVREKAKKTLQLGEKERQSKRIQSGISALLQGDNSRLRNKEIVEHLPATVNALIQKGKDKAAAQIIEKITREIATGDEMTRALLNRCLIQIGEILLNNEKWGWLEKLSVPLMAWLKEINVADEMLEKAAEILISLQKYHWENEKPEKANKIMALFFAIRTGKLAKSDEVTGAIGKVQDVAVERTDLIDTLDRCVTEDLDYYDRHLILQGPLAARYLLQVLFTSPQSNVRLKVLELLGYMGPILPPIISDKLREPMPWYAKRNLIKLLATVGSEKDILRVADYLNHEDIRVQKETFACIQKLSGEDRKTNLLEALALATGPMKEQIIRALTPLVDEEVVSEVLEVAQDWHLLAEEIRDSLLVQIFRLLARTKSKDAERFLQEFLQHESKKEYRNLSSVLWKEAKEALRKIKLLQHHDRSEVRGGVQIGFEDAAAAGAEADGGAAAPAETAHEEMEKQRPITDLPEEVRIRECVASGDLEEAKKQLVVLIEKVASVRNFDQADALRQWLIDVDSTALQEIIRSAEIIENYKSESIDHDFLHIWSRLYDHLNTEEFNTFYYAMEHISLPQEEILVRQGDDRPALFFVNHGKLKVYYSDKNREIFLKNYMPGDVFGSESFFESSYWTVTVAALSRSQISVLPVSHTVKWKEDFPALEAKLQEFCKQRSAGNVIPEHHASRRQYERTRIGGDIFMEVYEKDQRNLAVKMRGELADVSRGGLSFLVRIPKKENARILLGRHLDVQIPNKDLPGHVLKAQGEILSVRSLYSMNNEYSAHIRFSELLSRAQESGVIDMCRE